MGGVKNAVRCQLSKKSRPIFHKVFCIMGTSPTRKHRNGLLRYSQHESAASPRATDWHPNRRLPSAALRGPSATLRGPSARPPAEQAAKWPFWPRPGTACAENPVENEVWGIPGEFRYLLLCL